MDFGCFSRDLSQKSPNTDLGFGGFHFSGDRTTPITNPFLNQNHQYHQKLNTTALMADNDLGLSQNFRKMSISDEQRSIFTGSSPFLNHSGFSGSKNLHGYGSRLDQVREGLVQSSHGEASIRGYVGYGGFDQVRDGLVQSSHGEAFMRDYDGYGADLRARCEGLVQSFNGESCMSGNVGDGDYHRLRLLGLQGYPNPNPNPSFNPNYRGFTQNMSRHNREYLLESGLAFQENKIFPPFSDMEGSRELEVSTKKKSSFDWNGDLTINLASMVDIYGSVYSMATDQLGCRFLQKLVEEGSSVDVMIIFNEVINHVTEIGRDQFGNYFLQKLLQVCNEEQRTRILIMLTSKPGLLAKIAINTFGTRVVQKLIETVSTKEQISLVKSALQPRLLSLIKELNGNHVILTCLKSFGPNDYKFILEAATKFCAEIATHRHGCCVLQRCVFYSAGEQREKLVAEISRNSLHLAQDPFGNYVVQYIIEQKVGTANIMFELRGSYVKLATQKFGSHVVEKCLRFYPESRLQIVRELVSVTNFEHLLQDPYANYVIQSALSVTKGFVRSSLVEKIRRCGSNLRTSPYCKKIFSKNLLKK
ncbi:Pumilio-like protein 11 [Cardamine amara subsp. amara]|uniref:Pumilio-like protein 11 n=1 Tax=Cardamine amara subsp. amara TaxID=228776 RepID=A0ABD1C510_CARAN